MNMSYEDFINSKSQLEGDFGFDPVYVPEELFDFQKEIVKLAVNKGRMGVFADTGLGKTRIELAIAYNIVKKLNKKVIIFVPLAVAFQFISEAEKMKIDDIEYCGNGKHTKNIVLCNYERIHYFDKNDFVCAICDESSILKNFKGNIKKEITYFVNKMKYRFLFTATPSPNDFVELGTSSEFLGYLGYMDMLTMFFKSTQNDFDSNSHGIGVKYYLKPYAEQQFFQWVNSWSIMIKKPSDIGDFSDDLYELPKLIVNNHIVYNPNDDFCGLFRVEKIKALHELRQEQKDTEIVRCEKSVNLAENHDIVVYWCNTNSESKLLHEMDKDSYEIIGSQSIEQKEDILINFSKGNVKRLVTKSSITGLGLNWQNCNYTVYFPTFSYESYYQAIRRFWRFGQKKEVTVDLVISENSSRILDALNQKSTKADDLYHKLINNQVKYYADYKKSESCKMRLPSFI